MKTRYILACLIAGIMPAYSISCKKTNGTTSTTPPNVPPAADTTALRNAASFATGVGINYSLMNNSASYASIVKSQFNVVTFEYDMKHGAIVQNDGSYNFSNADELLNLVHSDGLSVYGHCLAWYQNNNGSYLRSLLTSGGSGPSLILNGSFEAGSGDSFTNWFTQVSGGATATFKAETSDEEDSSRALECQVTTPGVQVYNIQAVNDAWTATAGKQYVISFWARSSGEGTI